MSSSIHIDNNKKGILILGEGPTQGLDYTTLTVVNIFVNATKIHQFQAKDFEIKIYLLCLDNV